jgi:hypothetical protein
MGFIWVQITSALLPAQQCMHEHQQILGQVSLGAVQQAANRCTKKPHTT